MVKPVLASMPGASRNLNALERFYIMHIQQADSSSFRGAGNRRVQKVRRNFLTIFQSAASEAGLIFQSESVPAIRPDTPFSSATNSATGSGDVALQLGETLRYLRRKSGLTLRRLSDLTGCSESMLSKLERGHVVPSLDLLSRVAQQLGTSHDGEEGGFVIEGSIEITVDTETHLVGLGGSFFFRSDLTHRYPSIGSTVARIVWVNSPPY